MANLTLRQTKGSPLTITEMDGNFEYFTGSYTNTGTITAQGFSGSFTGSLQGTAQTASYVTNLNQNVIISGSSVVTGSSTLIGDLVITGSISLTGSALITLTTQSTLPSAASFPFSIAVSSSGKPFFSSASAWYALF
jgi:hypothetical protein